MNDITKLLDEPDASIAVVGATDNSSKYGHVIYRDLKHKGFTVYPVNPQRTSVDGDPAFPNVGDIPGKPTIVNFVRDLCHVGFDRGTVSLTKPVCLLRDFV